MIERTVRQNFYFCRNRGKGKEKRNNFQKDKRLSAVNKIFKRNHFRPINGWTVPEIFNFLCSVLAGVFLTSLAINVTYYFKKKVELRGVLNHHTALVSHILDNFLKFCIKRLFSNTRKSDFENENSVSGDDHLESRKSKSRSKKGWI